MSWQQIVKVAQGHIEPSQVKRLFVVVDAIFISCWAFARSCFIETYKIDTQFISAQGNYWKNPIGAPVFVASTVMMAFSMLAFLNHVRLMFDHAHALSCLMGMASWIGCIGFAFVAIFPDGSGVPFCDFHGKAALLAFSGLGVALGACTILMALHANSEHWPSKTHVAGIVLTLAKFASILMFLEKGCVMQWIGFMGIYVWFHAVVLTIPDYHERVCRIDHVE